MPSLLPVMSCHQNPNHHWNAGETCGKYDHSLCLCYALDPDSVQDHCGVREKIKVQYHILPCQLWKPGGSQVASLHVRLPTLLLQIKTPRQTAFLITGNRHSACLSLSSGFQFPSSPQNYFNKSTAKRLLIPLILQISSPRVPVAHSVPEHNRRGMLCLFLWAMKTDD